MKKNKIEIFIYFISLVILWSCNFEKNKSKTEFKEAVFYEVFPSLLDSIYQDYRMTFPPPPPIFKWNSPYTQEKFDKQVDSLKIHSPVYKKIITNWKKTEIQS